MSDFISKVKEFNELAGNENEYNIDKMMLYTGLIAEEFGELLESIKSTNPTQGAALEILTQAMQEISTLFKKHNELDKKALVIDKVAFLDAAMDIMVVACGAGIAVGADVQGAANEVMDSNLTKFPEVDGQRTVIKDENGKVKKPESYRGPELEQFLK